MDALIDLIPAITPPIMDYPVNVKSDVAPQVADPPDNAKLRLRL